MNSMTELQHLKIFFDDPKQSLTVPLTFIGNNTFTLSTKFDYPELYNCLIYG